VRPREALETPFCSFLATRPAARDRIARAAAARRLPAEEVLSWGTAAG